MKKYIAIIGDLIQSKKIENRNVFQENLKQIFNNLNKRYKETIISNFTLTIGDEFQAILKLDKNLMKILDELYLLIPHEFRIGIGYGEISTQINPILSIGSDGEAFWNARAAIEYIYNNNYSGRSNIYFKSEEEDIDEIINTIFLLSETIKNQWTDLQKETFQAMLNEDIYKENFNQQNLAKKMKISQSSLSKRLSLGNIKIYLHARNQITKILEDNYEYIE